MAGDEWIWRFEQVMFVYVSSFVLSPGWDGSGHALTGDLRHCM